jgi:hypothetical protein
MPSLTVSPDPRKGIPRGMLRIVGFDPSDKEWFGVDETAVHFDAYRLADSVNIARRQPQDIAYFVYDSDTLQLRGPQSLATEPRHCVKVARG